MARLLAVTGLILLAAAVAVDLGGDNGQTLPEVQYDQQQGRQLLLRVWLGLYSEAPVVVPEDRPAATSFGPDYPILARTSQRQTAEDKDDEASGDEASRVGEAVREVAGSDLIAYATAYYGIEWAAPALTQTRWCESSWQVDPCAVGYSGERGPYQFLPSTWATTPYAHLDPCDPRAATMAAAWMIKVGRQYEFSCWPR